MFAWISRKFCLLSYLSFRELQLGPRLTHVLSSVKMEFKATVTTPKSSEISEVFLITYKYTMPLISAIGLIGNVLNLVVLTSKELQTSSRGQRVSQRSKSMFTFMKALAISDILFMMMNIQGCIFIDKGYFRLTDPVPIPTRGMAKYIWNYMAPAWNCLMSCSDFIVVVMTIVR